MSNNHVSNRMGSWSSNTIYRPARDPRTRFQAAVARLNEIRQRLLALVTRARHNGFDSRELLNIPAIRQTLRAALTALAAYRTALLELPPASAS